MFVFSSHVETVVLLSHKKADTHINVNVEFGEGGGKIPVGKIAEKAGQNTASDGRDCQVDYFNLDVIISVSYRVKSLRGTQFRIWASNILKEYMKKGSP